MKTLCEEGRMGIKDFEEQQKTIAILRASRMWENKGIWSQWIHRSYSKNKPLDEINNRYIDSFNWRQVLKNKE